MSVRPFVPPHETTLLALDTLSRHFITVNYMKICRQNSVQFKIWSEITVHLARRSQWVVWEYLALCPTPLTKARLGCHGNEAMAVPFRYEISERASHITLHIHYVSSWCIYRGTFIASRIFMSVKMCNCLGSVTAVLEFIGNRFSDVVSANPRGVFFPFETSLLYNLYSLILLFGLLHGVCRQNRPIGAIYNVEYLMKDELERIWNEAVGAKSRHYARIYMEGLRNAVTIFCCDIRCPGRDVSRVPPRIEDHTARCNIYV
jgi:hypothetical protein